MSSLTLHFVLASSENARIRTKAPLELRQWDRHIA